MPPAASGGISFCLTPAVRQSRVTTIVVVVNIYTYKYYYVSRHFQLPYDIPMNAQSMVAGIGALRIRLVLGERHRRWRPAGMIL